MLCSPIVSDDLNGVREANEKADLIELRLDLFQPADLKMLRRACRKPVIFTLKKVSEAHLALNPDYIDLPDSVEFDHPGRIVSFHDFEKTPDLSRMIQRHSGIYKIATMAHSTIDALKMLQWVKKTGSLGLCMGGLGEVTRILAPVFGAPWTYAPVSPKHRSAPGQLLIDELLNTYHYRSLSSKTGLYGLIGDPVSQSPSHKTHNFAYAQLGLDAVYVKMRVTKEELPQFFSIARDLFHGLSVTMPHKRKVTCYLDQYEGDVINTVGFCDRVYGWNTDGEGALNAIEKRMRVSGKTIAILGSGGSAIAIAAEAEKRGAHTLLIRREESLPREYDILINCTPVCPISSDLLLENRLVMEIRHGETPLLLAAKEKGCETIDGMEMFIQQAIGQFVRWYDVER